MNDYDTEEVAFERLMEGLLSRSLFAHGSGLHGFYDLDDAEELRHHAENVLGVRVNWSEFQFRCSC